MSEIRALVGDDARLMGFARRFAIVFLPCVILVLAWNLAPGESWRVNRMGNLLGHDFSQVWVAGRAAIEGQAASVYDVQAHIARQIALFGLKDSVFAWHYPPPFLLLSAALGVLPYPVALLAWLCLSTVLYVAAIRSITPRWDVLLIALAVPLFYRNLGYGQNGLLTASLLTLGVTALDRRPMLAGLCFGLLCYKPQLGAIVPLALIAGGRWKAMAAAALTVALLVLSSLAVFGVETWAAFLASLKTTNEIILRDAMAGLDLNMSAFGAVRLLGGSMGAAWAAQAVVMAGVAACVVLAWRSRGDRRLAYATLLAGAPLMSPYVPEYDLAVLVPAMVLALTAVTAGGNPVPSRLRFVAIAGLFGSMAPRSIAMWTGIPLGFLVAFAVFAGIATLALSADAERAPGPVPAAA
jgi:hypothetical protein